MNKGFSMAVGNKIYFLISDKKNITNNIVKIFINKICAISGFSQEFSQELTEKYLEDKATLDDIKYKIQSGCIIEKKHIVYNENVAKEIGKTEEDYYYISGKNFGGSYDINEVVIIKG